jgi:hypothetical protein
MAAKSKQAGKQTDSFQTNLSGIYIKSMTCVKRFDCARHKVPSKHICSPHQQNKTHDLPCPSYLLPPQVFVSQENRNTGMHGERSRHLDP